MSVGPVQYARNGSARIAYRVIGDAETPLVWVPGWVSNVDTFDDPEGLFTAMGEELGASTRLVVWDKRGTGLSDPVTGSPPLDERMDDLRAVMDAAGVEDAALFGVSEGGPMSLLFAATYPERVRRLVLYGTAARFSCDPPSHPWGFTKPEIDLQLQEIDEKWGEGALIDLFAGSIADVDGVREWWGRSQRSGASPTMAKLVWQALMELDVREVLPSVETPTLVLHRRGDRVAPIEAAEAMVAALPNAVLCELSPGDHVGFDIGDAFVSEILGFVVGEKGTTPTSERLLATVLFTDIVGSTEAVSAQGDERWRGQLDAHDEIVERHLSTFGGRKIKQTGDGVFAVFDGPTKAARCALDLVPALARRGIRIRAGVHIGECERRGDDWSGVSVHIGARVAAMADAGEVLVSRTVRDLSAGSGLVFQDRGTHQLKGVSEEWQIFRVS
jgi:class 3 adenylate cyclase/pimeloyl-ACP methyl ester carboxylesterase